MNMRDRDRLKVRLSLLGEFRPMCFYPCCCKQTLSWRGYLTAYSLGQLISCSSPIVPSRHQGGALCLKGLCVIVNPRLNWCYPTQASNHACLLVRSCLYSRQMAAVAAAADGLQGVHCTHCCVRVAHSVHIAVHVCEHSSIKSVTSYTSCTKDLIRSVV